MQNIVLGGSAGGKKEDFTKAFEQPLKSSNQGAKTPGAETGAASGKRVCYVLEAVPYNALLCSGSCHLRVWSVCLC